MPKPHLNGQLENCDDWVEKLQQLLGGCVPTYQKANGAHMILSTLPPWLKGIINTRVGEATQHQESPRRLNTHEWPPPSNNCGIFWNNASMSMTPQGPMKDGEPSPLGSLKGK